MAAADLRAVERLAGQEVQKRVKLMRADLLRETENFWRAEGTVCTIPGSGTGTLIWQ